jgi:hypothetical protein
MLYKDSKKTTGSGNLQFLVMAVILVVAGYVGIQMGKPYYAYRSLQSTMRQWAKITLFRGGRNYSDLIEKMKWTIDRHKIPLDVKDVEIVYDPEEKMLSVYAEYNVDVEFPGYVHHYFFQPYAEVYADDD